MKNIQTIILFLTTILLISCHKEFLDLKRDKQQVVPKTIKDFKAILGHSAVLNSGTPYSLGIMGSDGYYINDATWDLLPTSEEKNAYLWNEEIYDQAQSDDWNTGYRIVLYANLVLEGIDKITPLGSVEKSEWEGVKGSALFFRSNAYFNLAQLFAAMPQQKELNQYGLPLRLSVNPEEVSKRATVEETYALIIENLEEAVKLLPNTSVSIYQPSKQAALALLARIYLQIEDYENSLKYSNECLTLSHQFINYNDIDVTKRYPMPSAIALMGEFNPEILFFEVSNHKNLMSRSLVEKEMYDKFQMNDLRKYAFFNITNDEIIFKGSYAGSSNYFTGISLGEVYLIRAECNARQGNRQSALNDLNTLLKHRIKSDNFLAYNMNNIDDVMILILEEREKELFNKGRRWSDLRRLNLDKSFEKKITRTFKSQSFQLLPNDKKYLWPIPQNVIELSGIVQNPR